MCGLVSLGAYSVFPRYLSDATGPLIQKCSIAEYDTDRLTVREPALVRSGLFFGRMSIPKTLDGGRGQLD
jgi:hypothetical protein